MTWELKADWPVKTGDAITWRHFEDLRKLYWSLYWGIYGEPPVEQRPIAYNAETEYTHNQQCLFEDFMYTYCPNDPEATTTGNSPAGGNDWVRTARWWVYSDFYPSAMCKIVQWRDSVPGWRFMPAWQYLPAPLNPYAQTAHEKDGYALPRPAELTYGNAVNRPVVFRRYYNDGRYGQPDLHLKQIVSGVIGAFHADSLETPGLSNYALINGIPHEEDALYDAKIGGYQSFFEQIADRMAWWAVVDEHFAWEEPVAGPDSEFGAKPAMASLRDMQWRCNCSAFEALLKQYGHFDWYLDLTAPNQTGTNGVDPRLGCWRRMWRNSHYWPSTAYLVWPHEMGTPPYANETFVFDPEFRETTGIAAEITFWTDEESVATAIDEALDALNAPENASHIAALMRRHSYVDRLWYKSSEIPAPPGYTEALIGEPEPEAWWYRDAYELSADLINDLKELYDRLQFLKFSGGMTLTMSQLRLYQADDTVEHTDNWLSARDAGAWDEEWTDEGEQETCFLGYDSDDIGGGALSVRERPTTGETRYWQRGSLWTSLSGFTAQIDAITDPDLERLLATAATPVLVLKLVVTSSLAGGTPPDDTGYIAYHIPEVGADNTIEGLSILQTMYAAMNWRWVALPFDDIDEVYVCKPAAALTDIWSKPPPGSYTDGDLVVVFGYSIVHGVLQVSLTPDICVRIDPLKCSLDNYIVEDEG